jgi:hypothetical protein
MILYHFTPASKVRSIKRHGLLPQPDTDDMSSGRDRVWLTVQPDLSLTKREAQWLAKHGGLLNRIPIFENGQLRFVPPRAWLSADRWVGGFLGGPRNFVRGEPQVRLSVRIRKNDSRLHRYASWRSRPRRKGIDLRSLPYARLWYVYQGAIAPDRIIEIAETGANGRGDWI